MTNKAETDAAPVPSPGILGVRTEGKGWLQYYLIGPERCVLLELDRAVLGWNFARASAIHNNAADWGGMSPREILAWKQSDSVNAYSTVATPEQIDEAIQILRRRAPDVAQALLGGAS